MFLPLTVGFFFSLRARRAVRALARQHRFDATLAFCSSTAHYIKNVEAKIRIVDFVDIDSEKWAQYAAIHSFPKRLIYSRESSLLRKVEADIHRMTTLSLVTSDIEKQRLMALSGENDSRIVVIPQGVDLDFYGTCQSRSVPKRLVFTGQMDYLPNIDGVIFFYQNVLPQIREQHPDTEFYIVGRNPSAELSAVCPTAVITGEVSDIRGYLHTATVVVAPLRLAFGMQSKSP
jgi:glycosyltransferase involved in cell wall biosynthesis